MGSFSKMFGKAVVKNTECAAEDPEMAKRFPNITLLMTALIGDDGKPRATATLTVCCEDGVWKGGLKERDYQMSLWRSGNTLEDLLRALETCLEDGSAEWKKTEYKSRK